jgi:glycine oxidase
LGTAGSCGSRSATGRRNSSCHFVFAIRTLSADNLGMENPDVLIIGAGVIGCSLARELARANAAVTVLDRGQAGSAASSAAAGLLSPTVSAATSGSLAELCYQSGAIYEAWVEELRQEGADDVGFRRPGMLEVWTDGSAQSEGDFLCASRPGHRVELLPAEEVRRREPALAPSVTGGVFYPDAAVVDPARLSREVARVAELAGVRIREGEAVLKMVRDGDRITAVRTTTANYRPGVVVLAAGAWSGILAEGLELTLPTRPVKGQLLLAQCRVPPVRTPLHAGEALFVPRADGLLLGVTVEEAGYDDRVTLDGVHTILARTSALVPAVGQLSWARAWAGLRPATPDGWPYVGPLPPLRNLWVSTGHFRKGILLAPVCARLLARSILANRLDEDLVPFKPTRRITGERGPP